MTAPLLADEVAFLDEVRTFVSATPQLTRSAWFRCDLMEVYLRVGPKVVGSSVVVCTRIANVEVQEKGKGIYSDFLAFLFRASPNPIVLENVVHDTHHALYLRRGFVPFNDAFGQPDGFIRYPAALPSQKEPANGR